MARKSNFVPALFLTVLLAFLPFSSFAQQSNLQTSFLTSGAAHLPSLGISADIIETEHLSYMAAVSKEIRPSVVFTPNAADLLIQQAEERFKNGKKFFEQHSFDSARVEFDAAIDTMLRASVGHPTDQRLFDSKLEDMVDTIHHDDLTGLGGAAVEEVQSFDKAPLDDIVNMTFPIDPRTKDKIQSEVKQMASALPLVVNDVVLGYINYFSGRGRKTIETGLERAGRYAPMVSRILAEEGVPQELIHLAQAESGFLPRAVSRAAAEGMWQFVKFRGNQYGLMQTPSSDDRLDPEKATRAAAHHLHDLYNEFGDWYLAIAAYNCGPGAVERAVERTGYADYWELRARHAIPNETANYVPIILAMTIMAKNAQAYGLDQITPDAPIQYDTVTTSSPTNLALIADLTDTTTAQLLQLNPAMLRSITPANFEVRVPKGTAPQVAAALELIPAERRASWRMHRVEAGESLAAIARQFNSTPHQIEQANNLTADAEPNPGDQLMIPAAYHEAAPQMKAPRTAQRSSSRKTVASRTTAAPARRAVHASAGTLAELKHKNPLNP
jgi:membrane-bound lytic murein transglycosylase D